MKKNPNITYEVRLKQNTYRDCLYGGRIKYKKGRVLWKGDEKEYNKVKNDFDSFLVGVSHGDTDYFDMDDVVIVRIEKTIKEEII